MAVLIIFLSACQNVEALREKEATVKPNISEVIEAQSEINPLPKYIDVIDRSYGEPKEEDDDILDVTVTQSVELYRRSRI